MDYNELLKRYLDAAETPADKELLSAMLHQNDQPDAEQRALLAIEEYTRNQSQVTTDVKLHTTINWRWQIAAAMACCAIVVGVAFHLSRPTVYCYYNGQPITSLAEAQSHAVRSISEMTIPEFTPDEEALIKLFRAE